MRIKGRQQLCKLMFNDILCGFTETYLPCIDNLNGQADVSLIDGDRETMEGHYQVYQEGGTRLSCELLGVFALSINKQRFIEFMGHMVVRMFRNTS